MAKIARFVAALAFVTLVLVQGNTGAWGNEGHIWINEVAASKMPGSMPRFFRESQDRLGYLGPEPDRWRNQNSEPALKYAQEPDHFIDLERVPADFGAYPRDRYQFMKKLYERRAAALVSGMDPKKADELLPDKVGLQPYIVMEIYERLRISFREYRHFKAAGRDPKHAERAIVHYAGWLGHYVADGSQPLHTSVNYDGWNTGPNPGGFTTVKGVHSQFEAKFVRENLSKQMFAPLVNDPVQLKNVFEDYVAYLKTTHTFVPRVYELEKSNAFKDKGTPEGLEFTRQRLAAGAQMLANMWYTAWIESAVDPVDPYQQQKKAP